MAVFQLDKLSCKKEVVTMIIQGHTLKDISDFISSRGEQCSKSSIDRYIKYKFIEGCIYSDGSMEVKEKEGHQVRLTKYPPTESCGKQAEIRLFMDCVE